MNGRTLRAAIVAGGAATAGLILAAAITATPHAQPDPTPTGYRPPLPCDYARTVSACPQLFTPYVPPRTVQPRTAAPRTAAPRRVDPAPRPAPRR